MLHSVAAVFQASSAVVCLSDMSVYYICLSVPMSHVMLFIGIQHRVYILYIYISFSVTFFSVFIQRFLYIPFLLLSLSQTFSLHCLFSECNAVIWFMLPPLRNRHLDPAPYAMLFCHFWWNKPQIIQTLFLCLPWNERKSKNWAPKREEKSWKRIWGRMNIKCGWLMCGGMEMYNLSFLLSRDERLRCQLTI